MDKRIIFTMDEGATISVIVPAPGFEIEKLVKDVPAGAKYKIVDAGTIPQDRTFRDAWQVSVDSSWTLKG